MHALHFLWLDEGEFERAVPPRAAEAKVPSERRSPGELPEPEEFVPEFEPKTLVGLFGIPIECEPQYFERRPWLTWGLAAAIFLVGVLASSDPESAIDRFGFIPARPWRLFGLTWLSAFFLHAGAIPMLGNVYFLLVFGDNVEDYLGRRGFALLLSAATFLGYAAHMLGDPRATAPIVGASGGISGVVAFYALKFPHARLDVLARFFIVPIRWIRLPAWMVFFPWLAFQFVQHIAGFGSVSTLAHLGGASAGTLLWLTSRAS